MHGTKPQATSSGFYFLHPGHFTAPLGSGLLGSIQPRKVTTIKLPKSIRGILTNANPRDSIHRELTVRADPLAIPTTLPANMGELITWAGDLGGAAYVYANWAAVIIYAREIAPNEEAARPVTSAADCARRHVLRESAWPTGGITGPEPDESPLALYAWCAWVAAGMPHLDAVAADTARSLWYSAGKPLRRILSSASDRLREARKALH